MPAYSMSSGLRACKQQLFLPVDRDNQSAFICSVPFRISLK